ncbi:MAG: RIP metalloprotease RseP [Desulfobacteraceae bacterium]
MSVFLYYIIPFLVVLGVLIFFHELGHFLVAKAFDVKVLKFSLGFGGKLAGKKIGETEYLISAVPLGGYVKMLGEDDEGEEGPEAISPEDRERAFSAQHPLKRIAIVAAGPMFNFFLALVLFWGFFMVMGSEERLPEVGQVREGSPAYQAGIEEGDRIISIDGSPVDSWAELQSTVGAKPGRPLTLLVQRDREVFEVTVVPEISTVKNIFGEEVETPLIGILASGSLRTVDLGPGESLAAAWIKTWEITVLTVKTVVKLLQRVIPIETVGGPIMIGQMTGQIAKESLAYLIPFMAVISVNLAVLNLLPVPVLDGGVIVFLLIELAIGRPLSIKKRELAQKVGIGLLVVLMAVIFYNDISRLLEPLFQ